MWWCRGFQQRFILLNSFPWGWASFHMFIAICISHLWSICLQFCSDYLLGYLSFFVLICRARWSVRCGECGSQKNKKSHLVFGLRQKWTPRGHLAQEHWGDSEQTGLLTTWLDGGLGSNLRAAAISSSPHIQGDLALGGTLGSEGPRTAAWVTIIHKYPIATECPPYTRHRPRQWTQQWMDRWEPCSWWVYVLIRGRQSRTDAEAEAPILWPPDAKGQLIRKDPDAGKDWSQEEKGMTEDEMVRWHHLLNGHEFEQTPGDGEEQGGLVCCSPWGCKESNTTERLNNNNKVDSLVWYLIH